MEFNNKQDIISHFKLEVSNENEIKKQLKKILKKIHPDKNKGHFKDVEQEALYHDIQNAIKFLDNTATSSMSLATKNDLTELTTIIKDLVLVQKKDSIKDLTVKKEENLTKTIKKSVEIFHKSYKTPKITSLVLSTVITSLWLFPTFAKDHPLLSLLSKYNIEFTIVWIVSLILTALYWIRVKMFEDKDKTLKQGYILETTQNQIFRLFILWIESDYSHLEFKKDNGLTIKVIKFTKDDLVNFLMNRYNKVKYFIEDRKDLPKHELTSRIRELEKENYFNTNRQRDYKFALLNYVVYKPGMIDIEIAEALSDLIIERLISKEVITKSSKRQLSDLFNYIEED